MITATCILLFLLVFSRFPYAPLFALLFGVGLAFLGLHPQEGILRTVGSLALIFYLFVDSARLHFPKVYHFHSKRLPTIGLLVTFVGGFFLLKRMFFLSPAEAFLCTLPLLVIDGKTLPFLVGAGLPTRIRQMTLLEGSVTGIVATVCIAPLDPIAIGVGIVGGYLLGKIPLKRGVQLLIPFALFALCSALNLSPYGAVIAGGLTFGHTSRKNIATFFDLSRRYGRLLYYILIILFGAFTLTQTFTLKEIAFSLLFLFGVRFLASFFSFLKTPYEWKTTFYFSLIGPKGLVSIALLFLFPLPQVPLITLTIFFSLILHSLFAPPLTHAYRISIAHRPDTAEHLPTVSLPA